jgi:N-acetylglucosaminyl-diphospho-decaprenol L-rhamnosyltransferase
MPGVQTGGLPAPRPLAPAGSAAVVVVSFNTRDLLEDCLASVLAETPGTVVVIDNASSDGSGEMVRETFPHVDLVANTANRGYGAGANQGIARCAEPTVILLNGDTLLLPGAISALVEELDRHPRAGIVGPRLLNEDGTVQASCFQFPRPLQMALRMTFLGALADRVPGLRRRYRYAWSPDASEAVPWVLGAALALRRDSFSAVGGFDTSYFMYSEEVDLAYRLAIAGWQTRFTPLAEVVHVGGASAQQYVIEMGMRRSSGTRLFYRKHYSPAAMRLLRFLVRYRMLQNLTRDAVRMRLAREAEQRSRLAERLAIWRGVLRRWSEDGP